MRTIDLPNGVGGLILQEKYSAFTIHRMHFSYLKTSFNMQSIYGRSWRSRIIGSWPTPKTLSISACAFFATSRWCIISKKKVCRRTADWKSISKYVKSNVIPTNSFHTSYKTRHHEVRQESLCRVSSGYAQCRGFTDNDTAREELYGSGSLIKCYLKQRPATLILVHVSGRVAI